MTLIDFWLSRRGELAVLVEQHLLLVVVSTSLAVALGVPAGSLSAWRERLAWHGVAIEKEVDWPRGGRSLYFRDPAGNSVEILTPGVWGLPSGW